MYIIYIYIYTYMYHICISYINIIYIQYLILRKKKTVAFNL